MSAPSEPSEAGKTFPRIIVGIDLSEQARDALVLARALSAALGTELIVAAAVGNEVMAGPGYSYSDSARDYYTAVKECVRDELGSTRFEWRELQDTPAHGLERLARTEEAEMVVLGSTHRGRLGRVLPGSVAESLLHGAPCAVAVAPRGYASEQRGGLARIGVGVDGSDEAREALGLAAAVACHEDANLCLMTVAYQVAEMSIARFSIQPREWDQAREDKARGDVLDRAIGDVLDLALSNTEGLVVVGRLLHGAPATALAEASADFDLLCVGSRGYGPVGRTFVGSVAAKLVRSAHCPVVVTPRAIGDDVRWRKELPAAALNA